MAELQFWRDVQSHSLRMSSFYGRPGARSKSSSQVQKRVRPGAVRRKGDIGAPVLPRKPVSRRRRALEDVYNPDSVEPYEPGILLQERPPVTFSEGESLSSGDEFGDLYGDDGDQGDLYVDDHAETLASTPSRGSNTGVQKRPDLRALLQEQQTLLRTIITKQEALEAKQTTFEQNLSVLEEKVVTATPSSSDSSHGN